MRLSTALAILVVLLAGCADGSTEDPVEPPPVDTSPEEVTEDEAATTTDEAAAPVGSVTATGTDDLTWEPNELTAPAGLVELTLVCGPEVSHSILIEGANDDRPVAGCMGGGSSTKTVELTPGTHSFRCTIPGHSKMEGVLEVT